MNLAILAAVSFLCMLCSCHKGSDISRESSSHNSSIRLNIGEDPSTLDPRKARSLCDRTLMNMLYEGLTRINKEEKVAPALAQVIEVSSDLMCYTFYLRDAYWTNGEKIKASDFCYAWKKILDPKFAAPNAFQLYPIKNARLVKTGALSPSALGVEIVDDQTLKVYLEQPVPYFLELTAFPAFFPVCESWDRENPDWMEKENLAIACGPFRLKKWKHNHEIEVVKNESYWDEATVKIHAISMYMLKEETEMRMFEKKELDWLGSPLSNIPIDAIKTIKNDSQLKTKALLGTYFLRLNTHQSVLKNTCIRKALSIAIDRRSIVDHVLQGNQAPATGLVPSVMGIQRNPYFHDHDIEEAKSLFKKGLLELKIEPKDFPVLSMIFPTGEKNYLLSQAIQEQWHETLGIKVQIQAVEKKVYFDQLANQSYDMAAGSWIADFNDPINFLEVFKFKEASTNNTHWENEKYKKLLDESCALSDPEERKALLSSAEAILMKEMPIVPVFYYNMLYTQQNHLKEIVLSSMGNLDFKWAHLENAN